MSINEIPIWAKVLCYALLLTFAITIVFPFMWMVFTSFKSMEDYTNNPFGIPTKFVFQNIIEAWTTGNFLRLYINSIGITSVSVLGIVTFCGAAGYGLAHFEFRGRMLIFFYFLLGMMIPPQVILIPAFKIMNTIGLVNTYFAVIFTYLAWVPFAIFFFRAYFLGIPKDLIEAAKIDGASDLVIFFQIMVPLAKPAVVTVAIIYFVWIFNDFMWPLIYLNDHDLRTVTLGMMSFQGRYVAETTLKTAALMLATMPPMIVFLIFRNQIQSGLVDGALKR
jgi:ABC-type glycerol-3-phosphate transport system permease component